MLVAKAIMLTAAVTGTMAGGGGSREGEGLTLQGGSKPVSEQWGLRTA